MAIERRKVYANLGALAAKQEAQYAVDPIAAQTGTAHEPGGPGIPETLLDVYGSRPTISFDHGYEEDGAFQLNEFVSPGSRIKNALDLSYSMRIPHMLTGAPPRTPIDAVLRCIGFDIATSSDSGHIDFRLSAGNYASSTFYAYSRAERTGGASDIFSVWKMLGARGSGSLVIEPGSPILLNPELKTLHSIMESFTSNTWAAHVPGDPAGDLTDLSLWTRAFGQPYFKGECIRTIIRSPNPNSLFYDPGDGSERVEDADTYFDLTRFALNLNRNPFYESDRLFTCNKGASEIELNPENPTFDLRFRMYADYVAGIAPSSTKPAIYREILQNDYDYSLQLIVGYNNTYGQRLSITIPKFRPRDLAMEEGENFLDLDLPGCLCQESNIFAGDAISLRWDIV